MLKNDVIMGARELIDQLARALQVPPEGLRPEEVEARQERWSPDCLISWGPYRFVLEAKKSITTGSIALAAPRLANYARSLDAGAIPVLVLPFMGDAGKQICEREGISWLDLSGNAHLVAPGLRILIEGHPNRYRFRGRPSSVFAPKSARIVRWLLIHPSQGLGQRELARATAMDPGYTNLTITRLMDEGYVITNGSGGILVRDRALLLDAWREAADFSKHLIVKGHIPVRSGEEGLHLCAETLTTHGIKHAATGLSGAWLMRHFAGFRLTTLYVAQLPDETILRSIGFRQDPRGANTWLVMPRDEGVFQGQAPRENIPCVHPVQIYVDLKDHPERAAEASEELRAAILSGAFDA